MLRILFALLCAAALAPAQGTRTEVLSVDGPRPLALAAELLEQRHGWAINYEDPPWDYAGDVEDRTPAGPRLPNLDPRRRTLVPKSGRIHLEYEVDAATGQPANPLVVLQALVDAHAAWGNPGLFRVVQEEGYFSILPDKVRDAQGRWSEATRILDTPVSFPAQPRSIGEALQVLEQQIQQRAGRRVWQGGVDAKLAILGRTQAGADNEPARVALRRIVNEPAGGTGGPQPSRKMVWHLYYQHGWDWALTLRAAPGQATPAFIAPPPESSRPEDASSRWFKKPAQAQPRPHFTREGVIPFGTVRPRMLAPGRIATIYGKGFSTCATSIPQNGPYPEEACGVRVTVAGKPAGLMYVGRDQINLKIPADAPDEGMADIQVCVRAACSDPVPVRFSSHKAYLRVQGTAYVRMPVWIEADLPVPHDIFYPYVTWPWAFGGYQFEVRRDGKPLPPLRPSPLYGGVVGGGGTVAPPDSPRSRLPLHLVYRFDQPGVYSVRLTAAMRGASIQSDWTDIDVKPFSEAQRDAWLQAEAARMSAATPGQLVGDIIPSLLAWPDEKALAILLRAVDHPDNLVRQFARQSLSGFDPALLRRTISPERLSELGPGPVR